MASFQMRFLLWYLKQAKDMTDRECLIVQDHMLYLGLTRSDLLLFLSYKMCITRGLALPQTPFGRWLTKGLYDPRLLIVIRDFLF